MSQKLLDIQRRSCFLIEYQSKLHGSKHLWRFDLSNDLVLWFKQSAKVASSTDQSYILRNYGTGYSTISRRKQHEIAACLVKSCKCRRPWHNNTHWYHRLIGEGKGKSLTPWSPQEACLMVSRLAAWITIIDDPTNLRVDEHTHINLDSIRNFAVLARLKLFTMFLKKFWMYILVNVVYSKENNYF